ncbi:MAG: Acylphosphate phosphohydrolase [Ktedonobacterales bacterium]|nr:MAG: Acylphosphate phosphohydrolase [Ktedonobacterales bacterium]
MGAPERMLARLTARVQGDVQGVGYRFFVRRVASSLGVRGYVRNLPDGNVEVVAEADRATLDELLRALWRGPSAAQVDVIDERWAAGDGSFVGFQIRH